MSPTIKANTHAGYWLVLLFAVSGLLALVSGCDNEQPAATPLKIGLLLDFTGSPEASEDRKRAFDLAVKHVNEGGGILGNPVESVVADATRDPAAAVEAARRLVEVDGIHALVGPNASSAALPISQSISGPLRIPTISPSATSPQLSDVEDDGYFFRTALSDAAQGPVLARVTRDRGFDNVGLIYQDDAWGKGLATTFEQAWDGTLRAISVDTSQTSFLTELTQSASSGAQALVVIAFEGQALTIVREAIDEGIYSQFVFGDAAKRISLVREIGGEKLGGMYGAAGAPAPENAATPEWEAAYIAEYVNCPFSRTSRRPTTPSSPSPLPPRQQAASTAAQFATTCESSPAHPAKPFRAHPQGSPTACLCLRRGTKSISTAHQARWTGTTTATSFEVTSGRGASHPTAASRNSTRFTTRTGDDQDASPAPALQGYAQTAMSTGPPGRCANHPPSSPSAASAACRRKYGWRSAGWGTGWAPIAP